MNGLMHEIYELVAQKTITAIKREKETKLSRKTRNLVSLTQKLYATLYNKY